MAYRLPFEVVFADVDMMGHVNNAAYFTYFETARTNYLLLLKGLRAPIPPPQLDFIVARASCDYKRGLRWGERCQVVIWPTHLGKTSFTFSYVIKDEAGTVVATGETIQVSHAYERASKKPIPVDLRARLAEEMAAGPGLAPAA